ncbi:methionine tRNA cytidine acetyltransferase [[Pantoea] beijingensis]|uniref:tRNA(Met) cytidine acetyltransferase TmcA n=1 Tax=[Pantoea] beijingensis TaxID=1324864 RepID=A0A443I9K8_9GAMM|nr:GNAT family N-acetyltransferase [[Pantoea] beijingensis]RWR00828.1 methionine tRNA cytidine acetyltransferase [[Pantoea] beijingensis]
MMDLEQLTAEMQQKGVRRLVVISGERDWCQQQALRWITPLAGDWLWVGEASQRSLQCKPSAVRTLLGREFRHAVFDARDGFHAEAFAVLAGTLVAGSWLVLLVPAWHRWSEQPDSDSLRWNSLSRPVASPNFIRHLQQHIADDPAVLVLQQSAPFSLTTLNALPDWQPNAGEQQQRVLAALLALPVGVSVLTAPRGRGKSALAGMLVQRWPGPCWVTAPAKVSTEVLAHFAGEAFTFFAPDTLLAHCEKHPPTEIDWLLIDEAAAIPTPILQRLLRYFPRILLTTTVQGYEGTGRGFLLKFCAALPAPRFFTLDAPQRWATDDPLEAFINRSLLLTEPEIVPRQGALRYQRLEQQQWKDHSVTLSALYQLLTSAHYRTSPLDLRRMMDAQGMHFIAGQEGEQVCAALWLVDEGGLSADLSDAIWAGLRRPRGNLVAQSLAAHAGFPEAAQMHSRRVSRIAIAPHRRRQGVGLHLLQQAQENTSHLDFLSVSFGYTEPLWRFWQRCGFELVRIGSQREASSGCYTAMALLPLSQAGDKLVQRATQQLSRDFYWLRHHIDEPLPIAIDDKQDFRQQDWHSLAGFAFAQRPFEASLPALARLLNVTELALPALRGAVGGSKGDDTLIDQLNLTGRKALLACWRREARQALYAYDEPQAKTWQERIALLL